MPQDFWDSCPKGTILPFAGDITHLPEGWAVCDGQNGTVDLVGRLPMGTATLTQIGKPDGSRTHTHTFSGTTARPDGVPNDHVVQDGGSPLSVKGTDHTHNYSGTTADGSSIPPVTYVFYIQKVS